ncbi:MAG: MlaD family protein [Phycisphaerae bacterium]|nr:MlaD family protein [Phycisphaerae bacterium]
MTDKTRNIAVGLTVIVALSLLGTLIVIFTGVPQLLQTGYVISMQFPVTYDIANGDDVHLHGMRVGKVVSVDFTDPADPAKGVTFAARINRDIRLPGNTQAVVFTRGLVGKGYLDLVLEGPQPLDTQTGRPKYLPNDGTAVLKGEHRGDGMFPPELSQAARDISDLARSLKDALAPTVATGEGEPTTGPAATGLRGTLDRLNRTLDALHAVLGSEQNQENIEATLARLADAAGKTTEAMEAFREFALQARESGGKVNDLADKLMRDADDMSRLMVSLEQAVRKVESGKGTLGKMVNDPQLYEAMVAATDQLTDVLTEARQLIETWRRAGMELKLK